MTDQAVTTPVNLHEYQVAAQALLSPMAYGYVAGGSGDEVTLQENRAAFARWRLLPRYMRGIEQCEVGTSVLGQEISLPVIVAPTAFHRLMHDVGETATARAATRAGTIFTLSTFSTRSIEDVATEANNWWFQLYMNRDRGLTRELVQRAEAEGAAALVVTVDLPLLGRREADERNRFGLPDGVTFANFQRVENRPTSTAVAGSALTNYANSLEPALTWKDLDWLASVTSMPIVPKGILSPADAREAFEHGARAIVVSNHGGRQLDSAVASLDALPAVIEAIDGRGEVLLDGGIRRGTDVLKAIALGAKAVLLGRPILWGLAVGGEEGVIHVLELLRAEIALDLILCGLASVDEINRSLLVPVGPLATEK